MRHNKAGNWAPTGIEIYEVVLNKAVHKYAVGDIVEVVESQHPSFKNHWQILRSESLMIKKDFATLSVLDSLNTYGTN